MPTPVPRFPGARPGDLEDLEELGDDAIIAQQTAAHLPQKRAQVTDESRSVVIAEEPPPRSLRRYRIDRGEPTLVIRDRSALDDFRKKLAARKARKRRAPYVWAGLIVVAFAMGGLLTLFLLRSQSADPIPALFETRMAAPAPERAERAPRTASGAASEPRAPEPVEEAAPPQVKLEELPVERKRRR